MINAERGERPYLAKSQLEVAFRRFVGEETGISTLRATPDVLLPDQQTANPAWQKWIIQKRLAPANVVNIRTNQQGEEELVEALRPIRTPGRLLYDKGEWIAVDENTPIGKIEQIRNRAINTWGSSLDEKSKKALEKEFRKELVGVFNDFASERWNGERVVLSGKDFRGANLQYIASRSLISWRSELLRTAWQAETSLFDNWDGVDNRTVHTPTRADKFVNKLFTEMAARTEGVALSPETVEFQKLLSMDGAEGYITLTDLFYAGDMTKAYRNISALAKRSGMKISKHWRGFSGNTAEFRMLAREIENGTLLLENTVESYKSISKRLNKGDMNKSFNTLSSVTYMRGLPFPDKWQEFQGSTEDFEMIEACLPDFRPGIDGYIEVAKLFEWPMHKTYINSSSVANMTDLSLPEGWHAFHHSISAYKTQSRWLLENPNADLRAYKDMFKIKAAVNARLNFSALRKMGPPTEVREEWEREKSNSS